MKNCESTKVNKENLPVKNCGFLPAKKGIQASKHRKFANESWILDELITIQILQSFFVLVGTSSLALPCVTP